MKEWLKVFAINVAAFAIAAAIICGLIILYAVVGIGWFVGLTVLLVIMVQTTHETRGRI